MLDVPLQVRTVGPGVGRVPGGSTVLADHLSQLRTDHLPVLPQSVASIHGLGLPVLLTEPADFLLLPAGSGVVAATAGAERHLVRVKNPEQRVGGQRGV